MSTVVALAAFASTHLGFTTTLEDEALQAGENFAGANEQAGTAIQQATSPDQLNSALWEAVRKDDLAAVKNLLDQGADPTRNVRADDDPIIIQALADRKVEMVELFLEHGVDSKFAYDSANLLYYAAGGDYAGRLIKRLIAARLDVNRQRAQVKLGSGKYFRYYLSPLSQAALAGNLAGVKLLLTAGADPKARDIQPDSLRHFPSSFVPLRAAVRGFGDEMTVIAPNRKDALPIIQTLLQHGATITWLVLNDLKNYVIARGKQTVDHGELQYQPILQDAESALGLMVETAQSKIKACQTNGPITASLSRIAAIGLYGRTMDEIEERDRLVAQIEDAGCVALLPEFQNFTR